MPTVNARRFALKLRQLRDRRNMTQVDVLKALGMSSATLIKYEKGDGQPRLRDLRQLLQHYGATEEERCLLEDLRLRAKEKGWWAAEPYSGEVSPSYEMYCSLELEADKILKYSPFVIHGLLQTKAYAEAVEGSPGIGQASTETRIALRMERWRAVQSRTKLPQVVTVMDEAALRRMVGGADVMIEQLQALLALPEWVTVHISEMTTPRVINLASGFTLFDVDKEWTVTDDGVVAMPYYERQDQVERVTLAFETVIGDALSPGESRKLIVDLVEVYKRVGSGVPQVDPQQ